jgi:hypothetical protein
VRQGAKATSLARGEGDELGERLKAARRVIAPPAAIYRCARLRALRSAGARARCTWPSPSQRRSRERPEKGHDDRAARREDGHRSARHGRGQPKLRARRCCDRRCLMRPPARTARLPLRHMRQRYRLHAGLLSLGRQHDCLCPQQYGWARGQGYRRSDPSARPLPASVRAASGAALVIFTAPLVVSAPAPTWPVLRHRQQREQRYSRGWAPQPPQARKRRARYRRAPSRLCCLRHSAISSRASAAAAAAAAHVGGRRAGAGLDWTDGPQVVSPDSSRPRRRVAPSSYFYQRQGGEEPHQQPWATLSAVTSIFNWARHYL